MTYIILKDTLIGNLKKVFLLRHKTFLMKGLDSVYEYEEEHAPLVISDAIVICEIVDTIDGTYVSD
jgi:hypothetical protein